MATLRSNPRNGWRRLRLGDVDEEYGLSTSGSWSEVPAVDGKKGQQPGRK